MPRLRQGRAVEVIPNKLLYIVRSPLTRDKTQVTR